MICRTLAVRRRPQPRPWLPEILGLRLAPAVLQVTCGTCSTALKRVRLLGNFLSRVDGCW